MAASNILVADGDHWFSVNYSLSDDETSNPTTDTNTFVVTYIPNEALDVLRQPLWISQTLANVQPAVMLLEKEGILICNWRVAIILE